MPQVKSQAIRHVPDIVVERHREGKVWAEQPHDLWR